MTTKGGISDALFVTITSYTGKTSYRSNVVLREIRLHRWRNAVKIFIGGFHGRFKGCKYRTDRDIGIGLFTL